ncbi:MAG TPA: CoA transferase, partial [Acidimicrobiales bacterium]|nr:CoA transferase [Acidimicrobiales bacterium]
MDVPAEDGEALARWAASGLMHLTGTPRTPLGPPAGFVEKVTELGRRFVDGDALTLLAERAAAAGLARQGAVSCGGSCRLLRARDGWIALNLARPEDIDAMAAWLERDLPDGVPLPDALAATVQHRSVAELTGRGRLLGIPVSALGEERGAAATVRTHLGTAEPVHDLAGLVIVDLTALWAGPLCGDLLASRGAEVVKVESTARPDGARRGPAAFFDLMNWRKRSVALDFGHRDGVAALRRLLRGADVVLESSRPRALAQLGIEATELVAASSGGPRVWVCISGYGRGGLGADRVAFGDDAAVGGGLVVYAGTRPLFCADAVADPVAGLAAAGACLDALEGGGRWLLDVSMAGAAAQLTGTTLPVPASLRPMPPAARRAPRPAPALGADTESVLARLPRP